MAVMAVTRTTIGQKVLMAVTGLIWIGFLVLHMWGNTKAFWGPATFDNYAHHLRTFGEPVLGELQFLMAFRVVTVAALILHIYLAFTLSARNYVSRGNDRYAVKRSVQANSASLTMKWGGLAIGFFVLFHLMQFTWGVRATLPSFDRATPYANMITAFQFWPNVVLYLIALVAVGMHLYHGTWSMFQTLGWNSFRTTRALGLVALAVALIVAVGFALVPVAVVLGILTPTSAPFMA
jgi:succinate dehydrogenase / fumarate reductase, cytochrome b subunit